MFFDLHYDALPWEPVAQKGVYTSLHLLTGQERVWGKTSGTWALEWVLSVLTREGTPNQPTRVQILLMATSEAIQKGTFYVTICLTLPQPVGGVLGPDMVYTVTLPECRVWIMHPRIKPPMLLVPPTSSIFDPTLDPNFEFEWQSVPLHTHSNAIMKRDQKVVCMGLRLSWHTLTHTLWINYISGW